MIDRKRKRFDRIYIPLSLLILYPVSLRFLEILFSLYPVFKRKPKEKMRL
jgi:hypothetical protein